MKFFTYFQFRRPADFANTALFPRPSYRRSRITGDEFNTRTWPVNNFSFMEIRRTPSPAYWPNSRLCSANVMTATRCFSVIMAPAFRILCNAFACGNFAPRNAQSKCLFVVLRSLHRLPDGSWKFLIMCFNGFWLRCNCLRWFVPVVTFVNKTFKRNMEIEF